MSGPKTALILLLLAILVRSLIPAGFMPDASKKYAITICSGLETKTIFTDEPQYPGHKGEPDQQKHEPCPFAPPILAAEDIKFDTASYLKISYARFLPDPTAHLSLSSHLPKSYHSQGPPLKIAS